MVETSNGALGDLTLGYSTLASKAHTIKLPADARGAEIVVIVQRDRATGGSADMTPWPLPSLPNLEGARVVQLDSTGVAKSRNEALRQSSRKYLLFCDDDIRVDLDGVEDARDALKQHGAAIALGQAVDEHGHFRKNYPRTLVPLSKYNSAKASTYEMLVDVPEVGRVGVWFDEDFGAGVRNYLGDEYIFVADALRAGLVGCAVPKVVAIHPTLSSGSRWGSAEERLARARAIERAWGRTAMVGKFLFALKNFGKLGGLHHAAGFVMVSKRS